MRFNVGFAAAIIASGCGGSSPTSYGSGNNPPPPPPPPGATQTVSMTDYAFTPATATVKAGTMVKWVNNGATSHTATSDAAGTFDSGTLAAPGTTTDPYGGMTTTPGGSFSFTFSTPGTYTYHCTFHGSLNNMKGTITVTQ
jgi:plastocyanin